MQPIEPLESGTHEISYKLPTTTMGELDGSLPHGVLTEDGRRSSYAFHPPNIGTRKRLGALAARNKIKRKPGRHVCYYLANALAELNGDDWSVLAKPDSKDEHARALKVGQLPIGDVLYLMFAWQYASRPKGLPLSANHCGVCGYGFEQVLVDLGTMECTTLPEDATTGNPPMGRVGLTRGFQFPEGKHVTTVLVGPAAWVNVFWNLEAAQWANRELIKALTVRSEIKGVDTGTVAILSVATVDQLWPEDVDAIDDVAAFVTPSPLLEIEVSCPQCSTANRTVLDWQTPDFFGA